MAEPKPRSIPCKECDHLCEQVDDGECVGRATPEERKAIYFSIASSYANPCLQLISDGSYCGDEQMPKLQ